MEIKFFGGKSFLLKGKKEGVLINPSEDILEKNTERVVVFTDLNDDFLGLKTDRVVIKGAGEYEVGGVEVGGFDKIYVVNVDGVLIGVSRNGELNEKEIEEVGGVDVLIASIFMENKVVDLAKKMGVNYLIPMDFEDKDESFTKFLDEVDEEELEAQELLKVDKDGLPEGMEVVLLKKLE